MRARTTRLLLALPLAAAVITPVAARAAVQASPVALCYPYQLYRVTNYASESLIIRNDVFGKDKECLTVYGHGLSRFTVTRSTAAAQGGDAVAFPSVYYGCAWGKCSQGSVLPEVASKAAGMRLTWSTRHVRPAGLWNTAYDIWFSRHRHTSGQAAGAEVMIWLNAKFAAPYGRPAVMVAGARWWFAWHVACNVTRSGHHCWKYVLFRRVHPVFGVRSMPLAPFLRFAERRRLLSSSWWLANVQGGFEVWRGGTGVGTTQFDVKP